MDEITAQALDGLAASTEASIIAQGLFSKGESGMIGQLDSNSIEHSPLDQIRQSEADMTRQIAAARKSAEQTVAQARKQARALLDETRQMGQREGQIRFNEIISEAEEMAHTIVVKAQNQAEDMRQNGQHRIAEAVRQAVKIIIGNLDNTIRGISDER